MARPMGPSQLMVQHGDAALRSNDLASAASTYIIGTRSGSDQAALNFGRLGLVLITRVDEETSFAGRAPDLAAERFATLSAMANGKRAQAAFSESLKHDKSSLESSLSYFGSAECLVEEAMLESKKLRNMGKLRTKAQQKIAAVRQKKIDKLNRHATKRYAAAFARDPSVNRAYDSLLPTHLDAEGNRTLSVVHNNNVSSNQSAYGAILQEDAEVTAHSNSEQLIGQDSWSSKVDTRPPTAAAVGKFDADGKRADAELAYFRRQHEARMRAAYSEDELRQARHMISQGLKAGHIRAKDTTGRRS